MTKDRPWPCPECGSIDTVRDEKDGYLRRCLSCGCRKAFEAFTGHVRPSDKRLQDEIDQLRDFVLSLPLTREQYGEFRKIESYAVRRITDDRRENEEVLAARHGITADELRATRESRTNSP